MGSGDSSCSIDASAIPEFADGDGVCIDDIGEECCGAEFWYRTWAQDDIRAHKKAIGRGQMNWKDGKCESDDNWDTEVYNGALHGGRRGLFYPQAKDNWYVKCGSKKVKIWSHKNTQKDSRPKYKYLEIERETNLNTGHMAQEVVSPGINADVGQIALFVFALVGAVKVVSSLYNACTRKEETYTQVTDTKAQAEL